MSFEIIPGAECEPLLDWLQLTDALRQGHLRPLAEVSDSLLRRGGDTLLSRAAWIDGLGMAVKTATIFPENRDLPSVNGGVSLYSDSDGTLEAMLDFHLVTRWKTAADSLLAARLLARPDSARILLVGAGTVARAMREAYGALFPKARFQVWSRSEGSARAMADDFPGLEPVRDLMAAVEAADIISCATMATEPLIRGAWLRAGQHLDLIGAYRPDMREADDEALRRACIFVDSRATTLDHIGEMLIPLESGAIRPEDVVADFYDIAAGRFARASSDEITLFKNGGGAHLDLMTSRYILERWRAGRGRG